MYSVSFGAKLVRNVNIQRRTCSGKYEPEKVSVVKLNLKSKEDINFLKSLKDNWDEFSYAENVYNDASVYSMTPFENRKQRILVLTSQEDDFTNLKVENTKGFVEYTCKSDKELRINYLQGLQSSLYNNPVRDYKHIGKELIKSLLAYENPQKITLCSTAFAKKFYLALGFHVNPEKSSSSELEWLG